MFTCTGKSVPGVHWPVYIYTDLPPAQIDKIVEATPLHSLHHATIMTDKHVAKPDPEPRTLSTDKHLTMLLEGVTTRQRCKLGILLDTWATSKVCQPRDTDEIAHAI